MASCNVTVRIEDRYNKRAGFKRLETRNLGSMHGRLKKFNLGQLSPEQTALSIITNLFKRDFKPDKKWDVGGPTCSLKSGPPEGHEFPLTYTCSQAAIWDHKDIYADARSSAVIIIKSRNEIDIHEYGHYVAG